MTSIQLKRSIAPLLVALLTTSGLHAALFEDSEARQAINDVGRRVEAMRADSEQLKKSIAVDTTGFGKSLLELQRQLELLRTEISVLRGSNEVLKRELSDAQRLHKDQMQLMNERIIRLEPSKEMIDGIEFLVAPAEKRDFDAALTAFRKGDFPKAQSLFVNLIGRYPESGYLLSALFWLGNAQYATRDYKEAIINFRAIITKEPGHLRAPESMLSIANCQLELKDVRVARKTLADLIKAYPQSEAAVAAKERLATLK